MMSFGLLRALVLALFASCLLQACGGDGGGSSPRSNTAPTALPGAPQTVLAGAVVQLDGSGSSDPEHDTLHYQWTLTTKPAGSATTLVQADTAKPSFTPDVAGDYVATLVVNDGNLSSAPDTVSIVALPTNTLTIVADQYEPFSGSVGLSLSGQILTATVSWFVDGTALATGPTATWDAGAATNTTHVLLARLALPGGATVDIQRTVAVANSIIDLSVGVSGNNGGSIVDVIVRTASPFGIASVSSRFDAAAAVTLNTPNLCSRTCNGVNDEFRFTVDPVAAGSGPHMMVITVTDNSGLVRTANVPVPIANAPTIALTSPVDGAFVHGSLSVAGSVASDKPGTVITTTASLGSVVVLQSTDRNFSGTYDLTGTAPGTYVLTVRATDDTGEAVQIQRTVIVSSSAALAYSPALSLGADGRMLAADGNSLVYLAEDQSVRLHDFGAGTDVVLQGASASFADWQASQGRAYADGSGADCTTAAVCVYQWQADGSRTNLSTGNSPGQVSNQVYPVAHDGFVIWWNPSANSFSLYNVATTGYTQIPAPAGVSSLVGSQTDFVVTGGVVKLAYPGQTSGGGSSATFDTYLWSSDTATSVRLSTPGIRNLAPQTDGVRIAWSQATGINAPTSLVSQPLAGGAITTLSSTMTSFSLRDGVLAWAEANPTGHAVKASANGVTSTLSLRTPSSLLGTSGGKVVYGELANTYRWDAATATSSLLIEAAPDQSLVSQGVLYFVLGSAHTLYKTSLN